jgi:hypothetical protein
MTRKPFPLAGNLEAPARHPALVPPIASEVPSVGRLASAHGLAVARDAGSTI